MAMLDVIVSILMVCKHETPLIVVNVICQFLLFPGSRTNCQVIFGSAATNQVICMIIDFDPGFNLNYHQENEAPGITDAKHECFQLYPKAAPKSICGFAANVSVSPQTRRRRCWHAPLPGAFLVGLGWAGPRTPAAIEVGAAGSQTSARHG